MKKELLTLAAATAALAPAAAQNEARKPNIVVILADDLGYGDLQCYGAENVTTPNVDRLAAEGLRMTNAHAIAATSTPSRYGLLTGEYAFRRPDTDIAAGNASMIIKPEQFTMADAFKSAGYRTAAFGKWHLGLGDVAGEQDWNAQLPCGLGDLGFDKSYIMAATADRVPCVFIEDGHIANFDSEHPVEVSYDTNFEGEPTGRSNPELLYNQRNSYGHDQSIVNGIPRIGFMKGGGKALWKDENIADSIVGHAIKFLEEQKPGGDPFFIYFCTNDIHVPRFPHDRFRGKNKMGLRGDAIAQFDWTVGQLVGALDSLGLRDNTLIILTSDNGPVIDDGYDDHAAQLLNGHSPTGGLRGSKYSAFEGGTRVPMIVNWQGGDISRPGSTSDALISQIDLLRSFASLIGSRLPKGAAPDSNDAIGSLTGHDLTGRDWVVEQAQNRTLQIRTPRWKYIPPCDGPSSLSWAPGVETGYSTEPQLYDIATGSELKNVAAGHPEIVEQLDAILKQISSTVFQKN